ncbi:Gfo/Idh/MocA family oxidoreductase, partial [Yoonia sp.]|nr:Gfo/Idh/MocA family oxidoreductase [Yoonia sp.]
MSDIILETKGLTKHYGGVHALEDADFILKRGEHVAIMGDNGAGKSTFVRQITGVEQRTRGEVIFDGEPVSFAGPLDAREAGIETVFQTLALADDLNVPDNLFLGREKTKWNWLGPFRLLDYKSMREDTMAGLVKTGVKIPNIKKRDDRVDLVTVATPNSTHFEITKAFLENGFHVLCEKPMTMTVEEGEEIVEIAKKTGNICAVNYGYTGYSLVRHMRAMIARGDIGKVRVVNAEFAHGHHADATDAD